MGSSKKKVADAAQPDVLIRPRMARRMYVAFSALQVTKPMTLPRVPVGLLIALRMTSAIRCVSFYAENNLQ